MKKIFILLFMLVVAGGAWAQWQDDPMENKELVNSQMYIHTEVACSDGSFYIFINRPEGNRIIPYLYYFNKEGNMIWEEPLKVADEPTNSWTKVNNNLMVDKDNNAIVVIQDLRNDEYIENYTAYKINQAGEQLWGENGICLHGASVPTYTAAMQTTQLTDGSYIFAWTDWVDDDNHHIVLQKVTADGTLAWNECKIPANGDYPFVVPCAGGEFIVIYLSGGVYARKLDFDGNDIWSEPTAVYTGSLNTTIPAWTYIKTIPADGGAIVGLYGMSSGNQHQAYISYIKEDGTHAFADGEAGLRLTYDERYFGYSPEILYDKENACIYAAIKSETGGNYSNSMLVQKVSLDGELLWTPNGIELVSGYGDNVCATSYATVQKGPDGNVLFGYMKQIGVSSTSPVMAAAVLLDPEGHYVWDNEVRFISTVESVKYDLNCLPYANGQWIFIWEDLRDAERMVDGGTIWSQNIRPDGNLGSEGVAVHKVKTAESRVSVYPNPVSQNLQIAVNAVKAQEAVISLYNMSGVKAAEIYKGTLTAGQNVLEWTRPSGLASGMYLLRIESVQGTVYQKVILK